ncbi:MAG: DoxX family protein [Vicinamibacteria bacterium]
MEQFLGKFSGLFYAAFRIVSGLLFAQHGAQKLFGWLGGMGEAGGSAPFLSLMFFAGLVEFFGGLSIAVGFKASWAAFIASGQMAVAYFMSHASRGLFPIQNRGELAVLYCFAFLYIASRGAGTLSLDAIFGKPKKAD